MAVVGLMMELKGAVHCSSILACVPSVLTCSRSARLLAQAALLHSACCAQRHAINLASAVCVSSASCIGASQLPAR